MPDDKIKASPAVTAVAPVKLTEKQILQANCEKVENYYGGIANIPISHDYWKWVNQLRAPEVFMP